jgi:hypothetical protein
MQLEGIVLDSIHASEAVLEACAHRHPAQVNGIYTLLSASHISPTPSLTMFSAIHPVTDKLTNTSITDQVKQAINAGTSVVTGHTSTVPPPSKPSKLKKSLGLDVTMNNLSMIDRQGPATAQLHSPFLSSPVIASTLLMSAGKIAKDHQPAAGAPSSPLVRHPIALPSMQQMMSVGIDVNQSQVMFEGQVRPVAVSAFEDLLFLMRIAKWKVAYHDGLPFERQEQLPYCKSLLPIC